MPDRAAAIVGRARRSAAGDAASAKGDEMTDFEPVVDRSIAIRNETDAARRRDLVAQTWADDATYLDPMMRGEGHAGIDAMIQGFQTRFPGVRFRRTGDVDGHNDRFRFAWELGPEGGAPLAGGVGVGVVRGDRLRAITGFLDFAPAPTGR